ncbi:hypothetical protein H6504_02240 [Candidatus Woesearchaeota archaeon]|nr:hypothetical protein [Candidatus Woesearchaeota archaeon]
MVSSKDKKRIGTDKMDTTTAIILTQIPIALGIILGVIELHLLRKNLTEILKRLSKK